MKDNQLKYVPYDKFKALEEENERLKAEIEQHHWIPISEKLPKDDSPHLFWLESGNVIQGIPSCELGKHNPPLTHKATHWKPIILPSDAENKTLKGFIQKALEELGVPTRDYPAPVANAVGILNKALGLKNGLTVAITRDYDE